MSAPPPILLAAGGTGGHVFPAEALARALLARGRPVALATDPRGSGFAVPDVPVHAVPAGTLSGPPLRRLAGAARLVQGVFAAGGVLGRLKPALVVGFGGYPSAPTVIAAHNARLPILLHEQNAVLGAANARLLGIARRARLATAHPRVEKVPAGTATVLTGNPVRPAIVALAAVPYPTPTPEGRFALLVMGGSQGAQTIGRTVPAALALLPEGVRSRLDVSLQVRAEDREAAMATLSAAGVAHVAAPFFADVPERLAAAHFVIARAGASTVAELAVAGRPSVLIPYPHHADRQQEKNAAGLVEAGAARLALEASLTPESLARTLEGLLSDAARLTRMAAAARAQGLPDAAERLADAALALIQEVAP